MLSSAEFQSMLKDLQDSFPSQSVNVWKVLRVTMRPIIESEDPDAPAVFIFAAPRDSGRTVECLAKKFARIVGVTLGERSERPHINFDKHLDALNSASPEIIKVCTCTINLIFLSIRNMFFSVSKKGGKVAVTVMIIETFAIILNFCKLKFAVSKFTTINKIIFFAFV